VEKEAEAEEEEAVVRGPSKSWIPATSADFLGTQPTTAPAGMPMEMGWINPNFGGVVDDNDGEDDAC
jgi:hypothetical protein